MTDYNQMRNHKDTIIGALNRIFVTESKEEIAKMLESIHYCLEKIVSEKAKEFK